jgi:hypothetical protein
MGTVPAHLSVADLAEYLTVKLGGLRIPDQLSVALEIYPDFQAAPTETRELRTIDALGRQLAGWLSSADGPRMRISLCAGRAPQMTYE